MSETKAVYTVQNEVQTPGTAPNALPLNVRVAMMMHPAPEWQIVKSDNGLIRYIKKTKENHVHADIPKYDSDWSAMGALVEWLEGQGVYCSMSPFQGDRSGVISWYVNAGEIGKPGRFATATGQTIMEAVCKAALAAMGKE